MMWLHHTGLPHSDTDGSKTVCVSPSRFAAVRVLLRLPEPRHPPGALCLCTYKQPMAACVTFLLLKERFMTPPLKGRGLI